MSNRDGEKQIISMKLSAGSLRYYHSPGKVVYSSAEIVNVNVYLAKESKYVRHMGQYIK